MRFEWGVHDCVTLPARCLAAQVGDEVVREILDAFGLWRTEEEALRAHGGRLGDCVSQALGIPVPWPRLSLGDIALAIDNECREFLCVCDGPMFVAPAARGLRHIPVEMLVHGWRIA